MAHCARPQQTPIRAIASANNLEKPERSATADLIQKILDVSIIDQRVVMPSRHTAAITAPFRHSSVTESSVAL